MTAFHKNYDHKLDQSDEMFEIKKQVRAYIEKAKYKKAFKYLTKISKQFPKSYYIASMLATLDAEDAFVLPDKEMNKVFSKAAKKLRELLYSVKGAHPLLKSRNINEYYWFSQQHKKQYEFGIKRVADGQINGMYSQGVGSANYAYKLMREGKRKVGLRWAQKSEQIWKTYFEKVGNKYHDPWYWYALALGLQGKEKEMEKALKKSAQLAKLDEKNNLAFKKLRRMICTNYPQA